MNIKGLTFSILALSAVFGTAAHAEEPGDAALDDASFISIVGGQPVPAASRFAKLTVMILEKFSNSTALCTGTLISKDTVLTAAHCVKTDDGKAPDNIMVVLNPTGGVSQDKMITVTKFRAHPEYKRINDGHGVLRPIHDLALLHLDQPAMGPNALIAQLPAGELANGTDVVLAGYGDTNTAVQDSSGKLYFAWTNASLYRLHSGADSDTQLRLTGVQPCHGDSGGPLFAATATSTVLVGVTSNGNPSCTANGTEMSVAAHLAWIRATAVALGGSI